MYKTDNFKKTIEEYLNLPKNSVFFHPPSTGNFSFPFLTFFHSTFEKIQNSNFWQSQQKSAGNICRNS
jgi:hypothetical protein